MNNDEANMRMAIEQAKKAEELREVPIGAVIVYNGEVIATGYNQRETTQQAIGHAEMIAINEACKTLNTWRLTGCTLYVTLEPCPMCAGAIVQSRIDRVVFGARDPKAGCCGTIYNLISEQKFNHQAEWTEGILAEECGGLLSNFFKDLRKQKKQKNKVEDMGEKE
ncbi:tRNA adenosine(34) deaminase TadA [Alkalihalobacterium bogoriense]|uniref:tRNA adenosine(34) deaminase TadA n=1 Tax=Alkalihalobacterium bogoriense TaxID=246272 RepID=UPI00047E8975|nr:tRNA adenosine(34) deaminase TadA [Alkalihalobacterium bogoriense]